MKILDFLTVVYSLNFKFPFSLCTHISVSFSLSLSLSFYPCFSISLILSLCVYLSHILSLSLFFCPFSLFLFFSLSLSLSFSLRTLSVSQVVCLSVFLTALLTSDFLLQESGDYFVSGIFVR